MDKRKWAVWPGRAYPLGATWDGQGVNFSLFSEHAEKVELCLFDASGSNLIESFEILWQTDLAWHCYLPEARPGQLYGYRVYGPYEPGNGLRFNHNKLLLDPYAKDIRGGLHWDDALFGYTIGHEAGDLCFDERDSAPYMPKSRVVDTAFSWGDDRPPAIPWHDTVIYEMHVKGFTRQCRDIPPELRGTYAGLASNPVIEYLQRLGITAIELMPVQAKVSERHLVEKELANYWGYNTIGFFAPEMNYSATGLVNEFKTLVKSFHTAGIEVILDVVYNHTAEGNQLGPTLCFRGVDNTAYYRLSPDNHRYYEDFTGTGNTLNMQHPRSLQLLMDSLRYWVLEMHVDGFRFDLAAALARELHAVDRLAAFFDIIHQDPVISQVKIIAEPWDLGDGGYQVGNFPVGWAEWNGKFRDCMRGYWNREECRTEDLVHRLTGSSDLYASSGRLPYASINFVTCHDGFTLNDLVTYDNKHNEANQEDNRDGRDDNLSWNCGVEGPTEDQGVNELRARQQRNFLAIVLLAQGVPMLLGGDEFGRTQKGNNNAYCQDNELSWIDWDLAGKNSDLLKFVQYLITFRKKHPAFRRRHFYPEHRLRNGGIKGISCFNSSGDEISGDQWTSGTLHHLGMLIFGDSIVEYDRRGRLIKDDNFLLLINGSPDKIEFSLQYLPDTAPWQLEFDTNRFPDGYGLGESIDSAVPYKLEARSLALMVQPVVSEEE